MHSLLYPPSEAFGKIQLGDEAGRYIYSINARQIVEAVEYLASEPLPDPKLVFPWLHGLHAENSSQLGFFMGGNDSRTPAAMRRRMALRRPPFCLRPMTLVKAGGNLQRSRLKGAISPDEILAPLVALAPGSNIGVQNSKFMDTDPPHGFNVRNFQIQTGKIATVGDVVVYGDEITSAEEVLETGRRIAYAQGEWKERMRTWGYDIPVYNTFVLLGKDRCSWQVDGLTLNRGYIYGV
jgi:dual specificity MAP kinase phosphatase